MLAEERADTVREFKREEFMKSSKIMHIQKGGAYPISDIGDMPHTHNFIEIVYTLSGKMTHRINGKVYDTSRGDILFMNYGCTHMFDIEGNYTYVNVLFSPEVISEDIVTPENAFSVLSLTAFNELCGDSGFGKISFFGTERDEIESMIESMLSEYENKPISWKTVLGNYLSTLIIKMLRKTELGIAPDETEGIWRELSEYIDSNLDSELTLSALARKCFYNPSYFSRVFKEKFGVTLMEYITKKRLEKAVCLLESTAYSIDDIARLSGFSDRSSLYHAFARHLGETPTHYRKK